MPLTDEEWRGFESYDWASDKQFTDGLASVLAARRASSGGTTLGEEEKRAVECKARLFFYSRKLLKQVAYEDYLAWKQRRSSLDEEEEEEERIDPTTTRRTSEGTVNGTRLAPVVYSGLGQSPSTSTSSSSSSSASSSGRRSEGGSPHSTSRAPSPPLSTPPPLLTTSTTSSPPPPTTSSTEPPTTNEPQYPSSFAHIVELITSGREIPGIRQIPNIALGETAASVSEKAARRKPWEK
ncbi:hypothetical protein BZA70DRAFT_282899 [Myxozyma melibiosi]|uniref:Uncharacterized protein n=1 Tax=Myxozyma melibiosi TaxID=54550 RepID=A0ABR1F3B4_9ASCO